jgi:hypothetical protein
LKFIRIPEIKINLEKIYSVHSNMPHSAHGPLTNTGLAGLPGVTRHVHSRRGHHARGHSGALRSHRRPRCAVFDGRSEGGVQRGRRARWGERHSPGRRGTGDGRRRRQRQCAAAFLVGEWWSTVGVEVLHHQEEGMKGEATRMRAESGSSPERVGIGGGGFKYDDGDGPPAADLHQR